MVLSALGITSQWKYLAIPILFGLVGHYLDVKETQRMTRFRDKSALYGRELGPDESPSW